MLAFLSLLTFYAYMKRKEGMVWLGIAVLSFMAAVLMRTNMLVLLVPIFALEYCRHEGKQVQKAKIAAKNLLPFAAAFVVSFAVWALMDAALGIQTMQKTFAHYFTYATGSNQDIGTRLLRTGVSIARVLARLTVPMALAFCISAWALWKGRWEMEEREKGLLVVCGAWVFMGVLSALLVTQGNVPAYFAPIVPAVVLVVGHAVSKIERVGAGFVAMAVVLSLAYSGTLQYIDFNEVNLLLMPAAALGAVALGGVAWFVDKEPRRLAAVLALMSLCASGFMLTDYRTYDAMRSESVADAAAYFNAEGAQKIAESQERTLDLYVHGGVVQYFGNAQCAKVDGRACGEEARNFPEGYYVVDFPLRPVDLPEGIGAAFRFNLFDKEGVAGCEPVREHVLHGVLVSEFYRC